MPNTYKHIASSTLSATSTAFDFTSIPNTYTDLQLIGSLVSTANETVYARFNDDTSNYFSVAIGGKRTDVSDSAEQVNTKTGGLLAAPGIGTSTSVPVTFVMDVMDYTSSVYKIQLWRSGLGATASLGETYFGGSLWDDTSVVTSIKLFLSNGNFNVGSSVSLYGILKA